jgi:hypothetical protein
MQNPT